MNSPEKIIPFIIFMVLSQVSFAFDNSIEQDTVRPVLSSPSIDLIVGCGSDYNSELIEWFEINGGATATDNSGVVEIETTIALEEIQDSLSTSFGSICDPENLFEVGFYAIDTCGNTSLDTSFARFQILDNQRPQLLTNATSVVVHCDDTAQDSLDSWIMSFGGATATDACSPTVEWFQIIWNDNQGNSSIGHPLDGPFIPLGRSMCGWSVNVSFLVRDQCGNRQITTASFSLIDTIAPVFINPVANVIISCDQALQGIEVSDNCNTELVANFEDISSTQSSDSTVCEYFNYSIDRLWTVTDDCGNSTSFQQFIEVVDTLIPSFEVPADVTVFCGSDIEPAITGFPTNVVDNCNPNPLVIFTDSGEPEGCEFVLSRFWQIADGCGSSNIVPQQITIMDTIRPVITFGASDLILDCDDPDFVSIKFDNWLNNIGGASAEDDCANVDWFAAVPGSYDINDSATFPGDLINSVDDLSCGTDEVIVDFVFFDDCGNAASSSASFSLVDTIAPIFDQPFEPVILNVDSSCMANVILLFSSVSDNCLPDSQIVKQIRIGNEFVDVVEDRFDTLMMAGVYDLAYHIADCSGNVDSLVSTITVLDNTSPVINCPDDIQISADIATCLAEVKLSTDIDVVDNCALESISFEISGSTIMAKDTFNTQLDSISLALNPGNNMIQYIARDEFGNESVCLFLVAVSDIEFQEIECKEERIFLPISDPNPFEVSDSLFIENLVDNCFIDSISYDLMPLTCDLIGDRIGVVITIFDKTGASQNCTSVITVDIEDFETTFENKFCTSDTLRLFSNVPLVGDIDQNVYSWSGPNNFVSAEANPVLSSVDSSFSGLYILSVTGEAGCNQVDSVMVQIQAFETPSLNTDNEIMCIGDSLTLITSSYDFEVVYNWYEGLFPDGNLLDTTLVNELSLMPNEGNNDYYVVVEKDDCTSSPSPGFSVVSEDNIPPIITCPQDTIINLDSLSCFINFDLPTNYSAMDDCGFSDSMIVSYVVENEDYFSDSSIDTTGLNRLTDLEVGVYTATYAVVDLAGNPDSCSFSISIVDDQAPVIICKNDSIKLSIAKLNNFSVDDLDILASATDNCDIDTITFAPNKIDCALIGEQITITVRGTDKAGNVQSCNATVSISLDTIMIDYTSGVCPGDTLSLFSNLSDSTNLSFEWSGPGGFTSDLPNPIIASPGFQNSGTYTLKVGSEGSCFLESETEIALQDFARPTIATTSRSICDGSQLLLTTQNYGGNITYSWYEGEAPNGVLIENVDQPNLSLSPEIGQHAYYVIVNNDNCTSEPAETIEIEVSERPIVRVEQDTILICDGSMFDLRAVDPDSNLEYEWNGPNGYISSEANPTLSIRANDSTTGIYRLFAKNGECVSDTVTVNIILESGGAAPIISGQQSYCEKSPINLTVENVEDVQSYLWLLNDDVYATTVENILMIPIATTAIEGNWTVLINNNCGTITSEAFQVEVSDDLSITATSNSPICGSASLQLEVDEIVNATYKWEGPNGFSSNERNPLIDPVAGTYTVAVTVDESCESMASTEVEIKGRPSIIDISSNIIPCAPSPSELRLTASISVSDDISYEWRGPNDYSSSEEVAVIDNFNSDNEGVYSLIIFDGSCESVASNIVIELSEEMINQPEIQATTEVCIGKNIILEARNISLSVDTFIWDTPQGVVVTDESQLIINDAQEINSGSYSLQVKAGSCESALSETVTVNVGSNVVAPRILSSGEFCNGETIQLEVEFQEGEYEWRGPNNFESSSASPVIFNVNEFFEGSYEVRIVNDDCVSPWSDPFELRIIDVPSKPLVATMDEIICLSDFGTFQLCIDQTSLIDDAKYLWINESIGDTIGVSDQACFTLSDATGLRMGRNNVIVQTALTNCRSEDSESITLTLTDGGGGNIDISAGEDITLCDDFAELNAQLEDGQSGIWSSPGNNLDFSDIRDPQSTVMGFGNGENIIIWTVRGEGCTKGIDTLNVLSGFVPNLTDDTFTFAGGESLTFNPIENDELPSEYDFNIVSITEGEGIDASDPEALRINPGNNFNGTIELVYEICNTSCDDLCSQAIVSLIIEGEESCISSSLITPNGDGINDQFTIPCLQNDGFPNNKITIFNQWGDEVYSAQPYSNNWEGTFNDELLPVGTYFFILDLGNGQKPLDGFIQLE